MSQEPLTEANQHYLREIYKLAQTYEEPFMQGQPDAVAYVLGRASVGRALVKLMKLKASVIQR